MTIPRWKSYSWYTKSSYDSSIYQYTDNNDVDKRVVGVVYEHNRIVRKYDLWLTIAIDVAFLGWGILAFLFGTWLATL